MKAPTHISASELFEVRTPAWAFVPCVLLPPALVTVCILTGLPGSSWIALPSVFAPVVAAFFFAKYQEIGKREAVACICSAVLSGVAWLAISFDIWLTLTPPVPWKDLWASKILWMVFFSVFLWGGAAAICFIRFAKLQPLRNMRARFHSNMEAD